MKNIPTVRCRDAKYEDKGKLLEFDDGSEWYSPIIGVSGDAVRTEVGVFNRKDLCCISRIKVPGSQYSGLYRSEQHPLVYRPERAELERVRSFLAGTFKGKLSRRELLITQERLQEKLIESNVDETWIVSRLVREANNLKNRGFERIEAVKIIARVAGVEIGENKFVQPKQQPLFGSFNVVTIQEARRQERSLQHDLSTAIDYVSTEIVEPTAREEEVEAAPVSE